MFETIFLGIGLFVGYMIGEFVTVNRVRIIFNELRKKGIKLEDLIEEEKPLSVYQLQIEKVKDTFYLYEIGKNEFICQATSLDELAKLALKYKNIHRAKVLHDKTVYSFIDGKIKNEG
jgi:hypothetical protein